MGTRRWLPQRLWGGCVGLAGAERHRSATSWTKHAGATCESKDESVQPGVGEVLQQRRFALPFTCIVQHLHSASLR